MGLVFEGGVGLPAHVTGLAAACTGLLWGHAQYVSRNDSRDSSVGVAVLASDVPVPLVGDPALGSVSVGFARAGELLLDLLCVLVSSETAGPPGALASSTSHWLHLHDRDFDRMVSRLYSNTGTLSVA